MSKRIFSDEERQSAQQNRRETIRRRAEEASAAVDRLLADTTGSLPAWAQAHVNKARTGKQLALIALKCGDCSGWQRSEIAGCTVTSCTLHPLRPYRD
jgi:hypothetical protein